MTCAPKPRPSKESGSEQLTLESLGIPRLIPAEEAEVGEASDDSDDDGPAPLAVPRPRASIRQAYVRYNSSSTGNQRLHLSRRPGPVQFQSRCTNSSCSSRTTESALCDRECACNGIFCPTCLPTHRSSCADAALSVQAKQPPSVTTPVAFYRPPLTPSTNVPVTSPSSSAEFTGSRIDRPAPNTLAPSSCAGKRCTKGVHVMPHSARVIICPIAKIVCNAPPHPLHRHTAWS